MFKFLRKRLRDVDELKESLKLGPTQEPPTVYTIEDIRGIIKEVNIKPEIVKPKFGLRQEVWYVFKNGWGVPYRIVKLTINEVQAHKYSEDKNTIRYKTRTEDGVKLHDWINEEELFIAIEEAKEAVKTLIQEVKQKEHNEFMEKVRTYERNIKLFDLREEYINEILEDDSKYQDFEEFKKLKGFE